MLSPYMPVMKIELLLREKSKHFRKTCNVYSMFYFDRDENVIYICSTQPGYWIGKCGIDHENLVKQCNDLIDEHNKYVQDESYIVKHINIKYIQCTS